jgi:hypothetical protein
VPLGILHKFFTRKIETRPSASLCRLKYSAASQLVVTRERLPLGLAAVKFWSRSEFKGTNDVKRTMNSTGVPIEEKESFRWLENISSRRPSLASHRAVFTSEIHKI